MHHRPTYGHIYVIFINQVKCVTPLNIIFPNNPLKLTLKIEEIFAIPGQNLRLRAATYT